MPDFQSNNPPQKSPDISELEEDREPEEDIDEEEDIETKQESNLGKFASPEAFIMFLAAGILDLIGLLIFIMGTWFAIDDYGILDIIGLATIGSWMLTRSGTITATKGAQKAGKKIFKRLGLSFLGELIPFFGGAAPCWLLAVYFELKNN